MAAKSGCWKPWISLGWPISSGIGAKELYSRKICYRSVGRCLYMFVAPSLAIALWLTIGLRTSAMIWEFSLQALPRSSPPLYIYGEPISGKQRGLCLFPVVGAASFESCLVLWHQSWTAVHGRAASWLQRAWVISQSRRSSSCNKSLSWGSRSLRGLERNRFLIVLF